MTQQGTDFERLVADYCVRNWGSSNVQINRLIDGREHDIVINTKEELIFIECTVERTMKKAKGDIEKIREARKSLVGDSTQRPVRGYFIIPVDPSPEVHKVAQDNGNWIEACSFPTFTNRFNCSSTYLIERKKRAFGSVRNPADDSLTLERNRYVQVPLKISESHETLSLEQLIEQISTGRRNRIVFTGDFGIGKSMLFREIFYRLVL